MHAEHKWIRGQSPVRGLPESVTEKQGANEKRENLRTKAMYAPKSHPQTEHKTCVGDQQREQLNMVGVMPRHTVCVQEHRAQEKRDGVGKHQFERVGIFRRNRNRVVEAVVLLKHEQIACGVEAASRLRVE